MAEQKKNTPPDTNRPSGTPSKIRIQYYRSAISTPVKHKLVIKGLGFTRLNQIVERVDNESVRGMVKAVPHLVRILEN
ncbi:MAG: 50S ribosomal protein L30 [Acidobacteria bacterium]|nr:50S ribosomal protein L30 [Acidobacteriota bacterium]